MHKQLMVAAATVLSCGLPAQADEAAFNTGKISAIHDNCPSWQLTEDAKNGPWSYLVDKYAQTEDFAAGRADAMKLIEGRDKAALEQDCEDWFESMRAGGIRYFERTE